MSELIAQFHIDWRLLVAQLVNFTIVLIALNYLIWKPLRQMMSDRTSEIQTGLATAESAQHIVADAHIQSSAIVHNAQVAGSQIRTQATVDGQRIVESLHTDAKKQATIIVARAHDQATGIIDTATVQAYQVVPELAIAIASRVVAQELSQPESSRAFVQKLLARSQTENI